MPAYLASTLILDIYAALHTHICCVDNSWKIPDQEFAGAATGT